MTSKFMDDMPRRQRPKKAARDNRTTTGSRQSGFFPHSQYAGEPHTSGRAAPAAPQTFLIGKRKLVTTPVFDTYWRFAATRQDAFFARLAHPAQPSVWTTDPILRQYKFTNAYRAADRTSQYLIRNVIYNGSQDEEEVFFRTILFKVFNRSETWELLEQELGKVSWRTYRATDYNAVLARAIAAGKKVWTNAYMMASATSLYGYREKHRTYLRIIEKMMAERLPARVVKARSLDAVYRMIRDYPQMGDFLAYQYTIDLNYGPLLDFDEDDFAVAGQGAVSGIGKCFSDLSGLSPADVIRFMTDQQEEQFARLGLSFRTLWGRRLHLIDCQNLFCETNKYARVAHPEVRGSDNRSHIKQEFRPTGGPIDFWFPPKWNISPGDAAAE